ncbi:MAG TPA: DUF4129 domain-containing protein [Dehalococcoidia bacterium]|nr:DUF4129 domain-containing protein [Dehalococcoidia bacterium]
MNFAWRRPLTEVALLTMESLWIYALLGALMAVSDVDEKPSFLGVFAIVFCSYAISRGLQGSLLGESLLKVWGVILSFLLFYMIIRADFFGDLRFWDFTWADDLNSRFGPTIRDHQTSFFGIPLLWVIWLRGIIRGQQGISFNYIASSFAIGLLIVGVAEVIGEATDAPALVRYVAVPYVALGLLTIGLAHAARAESSFGRSFGWTWLAGVGGAVVVVSLVALLFAVVSMDTAQNVLGDVVRPLAWLLGHALYYILYPIVYVFDGVLIAVRWMFENILGSKPREDLLQNQPDPGAPPPDQLPQGDGGGANHWVSVVFHLAVTFIAVALGILGTALVFARYLLPKSPTEVHEAIAQVPPGPVQPNSWFGSLMSRLRSFGGRPGGDPTRRIYFEMLALAERRGVERRPPETPDELLPRLQRTLRGEASARITSAFDESRYGGIAARPGDVTRLREDLEKLQGA